MSITVMAAVEVPDGIDPSKKPALAVLRDHLRRDMAERVIPENYPDAGPMVGIHFHISKDADEMSQAPLAHNCEHCLGARNAAVLHIRNTGRWTVLVQCEVAEKPNLN